MPAGSACLTPAKNPAAAASNPDTSSLFASGITGTIRDMKVDQAGNLLYMPSPATARYSGRGVRATQHHTGQPIGLSINKGQSATFTVGASAPALLLPVATPGRRSCHGSTSEPIRLPTRLSRQQQPTPSAYCVIVINSAGSVISDPITLAVSKTCRA